MAQLIFEGAERKNYVEVKLKKVDDASIEDVEWCDGMAMGSPTHCGILTDKLKSFIDNEMHKLWGKIDGKIGTAFSSSRGLGGGNELTCFSILNVLINFGFLVFGLTDYSGDTTGHYGAVALSEPKDKEAEICKILGERLAEYTKKFS